MPTINFFHKFALSKTKDMIIIGITGTIGAGKGTIVEYLIEKHGFQHYSVRNYLIKVAQQRNIPLCRDSYVVIANELRSQHSPSFIIDELYQEALTAGGNAIIESIRTEGEISSLRKKGNFILFAIDADPQIRYQRITTQRKSETDNISFEKFLADEKKEMTSTNPNHQNLSKCIELADYIINNNGDFEQLHRQIDEILAKIQ